jgi:hypothetical protein
MKFAKCHPEEKHAGRGMCSKCYQAWHYKTNKDVCDARAKRWRDDNKEKHNANKKAYSHSDPEKFLWKTAKHRARKRGLEFNLTREDIVIPVHCPVLGIPLVPFSGRFAHNSPSIDRIDNHQGYVKGNIIVVSFRANSLKKDATVDELQKLSDFYTKLGVK